MKAASQIIIDSASFMIVFILGNFFDTAFWQAGYHAKKLLSGKPLPAATGFFIEHHHLPVPLALLPWLWLVGAPLLTRHASRNYWEAAAFMLRFCAFITCEVLLSLVLLFSLSLPLVTYYAVLRSDEQSTAELVVWLLFWLVVVSISLAALYRAYQFRRNPNA